MNMERHRPEFAPDTCDVCGAIELEVDFGLFGWYSYCHACEAYEDLEPRRRRAELIQWGSAGSDGRRHRSVA